MSFGRTATSLIVLLAGVDCTSIQAAVPESPEFRVTRRGVATIPHVVTDKNGHEVPVTGLSGITRLEGDRYAAIMDNSDRVLLFTLPISADGAPGEPHDFDVVTLAERHDYEDIAVCPPPLQERIAARQLRRGLPDPGRCLLVAEEDTPAIRAMSLVDGSLLGVIPIPEIFGARRPNRGLESLDIDPDGRHIWTANEEALAADGPTASATAGTVVRITKLDISQTDAQAKTASYQYAYAVDPPHAFVRLINGDALAGVVALVGLGGGRLLVLERAGCPGIPAFESRLYLVDTSPARTVSHLRDDLELEENYRLRKTLLWKDQVGCNIEGLCFGPTLPSACRTLLGISDNGASGTPSQIVLLALEETAHLSSLQRLFGGLAVAALGIGILASTVAFRRG